MVQRIITCQDHFEKLKIKQDLSWTHYLTVGSVDKHFLVLETAYMKEKSVFDRMYMYTSK